MNLDVEKIKYDQNGLVPAIIQDFENNEVLMLGYMNKDSLLKTIETQKATFWSRSRQKYWIKGESSGNFQEIKEAYYDCDTDTFLFKVKQLGAACHEGYRTCFFRKIVDKNLNVETVGEPLFDPNEVYKK